MIFFNSFSGLKNTIHPSDYSLGELALSLKQSKDKKTNNELQGDKTVWTKGKIRDDVRAIVASVIGISNNFSDDADFIKTLGAG